MRGLDTNVLVRLITQDNPDQASAVLSLLEDAETRDERFFVSTIVVCELAWTLRSRPYQFRRAAIAEALTTVLETRLFEIQDRELIQQTIAQYQRGRADFSDFLIGAEHQRAGCSDTVTFDSELAKVDRFSLLSVA